MSRVLVILVALTLLLAAGIGHGLLTERWRPSEAMTEAIARVESLPTDIGAWTSRPEEQDPSALELAGAVANYSRSFLDPKTGDRILVILLAGKANRMVVHRPEHCYKAAGYDMNGPAVRVKIQPEGEGTAEFFTGLFSRDEATGPSRLRIFWSFFASGKWSSPDSPRMQFAREKVLYKLYVIRSVAGTNESVAEDPSIRLLGELLPILDRSLSPPEG